MTANKLFPINPRAITGPPKMSLLFEVESTSALIIEPRLILVTHMDDLGWYITSNQQGKMIVQNLHRIVGRPNATTGQIPHCTTDCIPINLVFQENFRLTHKIGTACLVEMTSESEKWSELPSGATTATRIRSGTSVIRRSKHIGIRQWHRHVYNIKVISYCLMIE